MKRLPPRQAATEAINMVDPSLVIPDDSPLSDRKLWTVAECDRLERYGFLKGRYELLQGTILTKTGHGLPHGFPVTEIMFWLMKQVGKDRVLPHLCHVPPPADKNYNRPELDIAVYHQSARNFKGPLPFLRDVLLAVEVSDVTLGTSASTLANDLGAKAALYARARVPEYWVLDVIGHRFYVHRSPGKGTYQNITMYEPHEQVLPIFAPDIAPFRAGDFVT